MNPHDRHRQIDREQRRDLPSALMLAGVTDSERIASQLGVSSRTIRRDIAELEARWQVEAVQDISAAKGKDLERTERLIAAAASLLSNDRFACFVVGDVRDPRGLYRNFVSDTIAAFHDAGLRLYNEAILVTAVGSLPIRVGRQFEAARKLGKTHQNVLVFIKGDAKRATEHVGPVEVADVFADEDVA